MLGLVLIYFIGKQFYTLAEDRDMHKWLYAIIGIATYYMGTFISGILIGIYSELFGNGIESMNDLVVGIIAIPFGLLAIWGLYTALDKKWTQKKRNIHDEINEIGKNTLDY